METKQHRDLRTPENRPDIQGMPLNPWDFETDTVDIYTSFLCYGAGTEGNKDLCGYCFLHDFQLNNPTTMTQGHFEGIVSWLRQEGSPIKGISLVGGEVALDKDIKSKIRYANGAGLGLHIVTNGSEEFRELLRDEETAAIMRAEGSLIALSLDSLDQAKNDKYRGNGAYDRAMRTVEDLIAGNFPFRLNATIVNPTETETKQLCHFAENVGAQELLIHFPSPVGRGRRLARTAYPESEWDLPSRSKWLRTVVRTVMDYRAHDQKRRDFEINPQLGYTNTQLPGDDPYTCDMRPGDKRGGKNLQFCPPLNGHGDMPVVACGLDMYRARKSSAYIYRPDEGLFERAGESELTDIKGTEGTVGCPLAIGQERSCIYRRLGLTAYGAAELERHQTPNQAFL